MIKLKLLNKNRRASELKMLVLYEYINQIKIILQDLNKNSIFWNSSTYYKSDKDEYDIHCTHKYTKHLYVFKIQVQSPKVLYITDMNQLKIKKMDIS